MKRLAPLYRRAEAKFRGEHLAEWGADALAAAAGLLDHIENERHGLPHTAARR